MVRVPTEASLMHRFPWICRWLADAHRMGKELLDSRRELMPSVREFFSIDKENSDEQCDQDPAGG